MGYKPPSELSESRNYPRFLEPKGSQSCLQDPATCVYPEPDSVHTFPQCLSKIRFNIILPSTSRYSLHAFRRRSYAHFWSVSYVLHSTSISSSLVWKPDCCAFGLSNWIEQTSWEADSRLVSQEISHFYGSRRFITVFTRDRKSGSLYTIL